MEGTYDVYFGTQPAGKVHILRQGLYYRVHCQCQLSGAVVCRLVARSGNHQENLGIPVPVDQGFELVTMIPVKRVGQGPLSFFLIPKTAAREGTFVPISPEEPFAYLERLKEAFLERRDGKIGVII